tara:strand:- start:147 stop:353 length:207 start_codon:yes stop_codon:yes gene_type:complete
MEPIENLNKKIKGLQKEINKIQEHCSHKDQDMSFVGSSSSIMWVCKDCKKELRWPSQEDIDEFVMKKK